MRPDDRTLDPRRCLGATPFIEAEAPAIREAAQACLDCAMTEPERAAALFRFVRDEIAYEFLAKLDAEEYRASRVLAARRGFCVQKAVLLCALGRAAGIPTTLVLSDLRDRTLPDRFLRAMGTDTMFHHGLNAFYLEGRWLLADASLSPDVVRRKSYRPVEFDGTQDALSAPTTIDGVPHADYLRFHGLFADLPFEQTMQAFMHAYRGADLEALAALGYRM